MNELVTTNSNVVPYITNYEHALVIRKMASVSGLVPYYLLAPEVAAFLHYMQDLKQNCLIDTIWNTGGRINEILALTPADFDLNDIQPFVKLKTLKQRSKGKGRPATGETLFRAIPLTDQPYINKMRMLFGTFKFLQNEPIWKVTDRTVRNWIVKTVDVAKQDGVIFSLDINPKTFRHSYAINQLYNHRPPKVLQTLMGHKRFESTEVYLKIFSLEVASSDIKTTFDQKNSVNLLKNISKNEG